MVKKEGGEGEHTLIFESRDTTAPKLDALLTLARVEAGA